MKFSHESYEEKIARFMGAWSQWFAWHPVIVGRSWIWLRWIERRATRMSLEDYGGIVWEYRES